MIRVRNSQRKMHVHLGELQAFAEAALHAAARLKPRTGAVLHQLPAIDIVLISDGRIAELHKRFMDIAGPTDVITFQHGEIFISVETARSNARRFRTTTEAEIRLYIAHGLLHLLGYDDRTARSAETMGRAQQRLVRAAEEAMDTGTAG